MNESADATTGEEVKEAAARIADAVVRTPVLESQRLNQRLGARLRFKAENLQRTGAFKYRGATNAVRLLDEATAVRGVATHSSGNHGAALARAARELGIPSHVVMPENSVADKVENVRAGGGNVVFCAPSQAAREQGLADVVRATGAHVVHPYDDARVIAGQGTAALELLDDVPDLDVIVAPVGGGGLLSGTLLAARTRDTPPTVWGAEPAGADDTAQSLRLGAIVSEFQPDTIADGLRARVGDLTFPIIRRYAAGVLTVTEAEIVAAMRLLWERLRLIVEPSSATVAAAIARYPEHFRDRHVGVILTGGNVALDRLPWQT